jgi:hypothetical protein
MRTIRWLALLPILLTGCAAHVAPTRPPARAEAAIIVAKAGPEDLYPLPASRREPLILMLRKRTFIRQFANRVGQQRYALPRPTRTI